MYFHKFLKRYFIYRILSSKKILKISSIQSGYPKFFISTNASKGHFWKLSESLLSVRVPSKIGRTPIGSLIGNVDDFQTVYERPPNDFKSS